MTQILDKHEKAKPFADISWLLVSCHTRALSRFTTTISHTQMISHVQEVLIIISAGYFRQVRLREVDERHPHVAHFLSGQEPQFVCASQILLQPVGAAQRVFRRTLLRGTKFSFHSLQLGVVDQLVGNRKNLVERERPEISVGLLRPVARAVLIINVVQLVQVVAFEEAIIVLGVVERWRRVVIHLGEIRVFDVLEARWLDRRIVFAHFHCFQPPKNDESAFEAHREWSEATTPTTNSMTQLFRSFHISFNVERSGTFLFTCFRYFRSRYGDANKLRQGKSSERPSRRCRSTAEASNFHQHFSELRDSLVVLVILNQRFQPWK